MNSTSPRVIFCDFGKLFVVFSDTKVREIHRFNVYNDPAPIELFYDYDLTDPGNPVLVAIGKPSTTQWNAGWGKDAYGTFTRDRCSPNVPPGLAEKAQFLSRFLRIVGVDFG